MLVSLICFVLTITMSYGYYDNNLIFEQKGPVGDLTNFTKKYLLLPMQCDRTYDLSRYCNGQSPYMVSAELLTRFKFSEVKLENDLSKLVVHRQTSNGLCFGDGFLTVKYACR